MAGLLSDFSPETVFVLTLGIAQQDSCVYDRCMNGALYVAAYSEGARQRDAARFLALSTLSILNGSRMRQMYRQAILYTTATGKEGGILNEF
jgi:hypothetical protein